jgi:hypothetical protein
MFDSKGNPDNNGNGTPEGRPLQSEKILYPLAVAVSLAAREQNNFRKGERK